MVQKWWVWLLGLMNSEPKLNGWNNIHAHQAYIVKRIKTNRRYATRCQNSVNSAAAGAQLILAF